MQLRNEDLCDQDIPAQAVAALTAASRWACGAGLTVVVLLDGWLVRQNLASTVALKKITSRIKAESRIKGPKA